MRNPRSADQFLAQVQAKYKSATMDAIDEPDGFGVHRSFRFTGAAARYLSKVLPFVDDPRIATFVSDKKNKQDQVTVMFTYRPVADRTEAFPLDAAETVADARSVPVETE
jgi:hypothetical protein